MYTAYSNTKKKLVDVENEYDLFEIFSCPNPGCPALFTIRSVTGKRAKHFAKLPSTDHVKDCPFANDKERYSNPTMVRALPLEMIYENMRQAQNTSSHNGLSGRKHGTAQTQMLVINTPNKLLQYCLRNPFYQEYLPGVKVDEIFLCSENLIRYGRFKGVEGIRLVVGETTQDWGKNQLRLAVRKTSRNRKNVWLNVSVRTDIGICLAIKNHLVSTYGRKDGQLLAVFGSWKIDRQYNISCTVDSKSHIIILKEEEKILLNNIASRD